MNPATPTVGERPERPQDNAAALAASSALAPPQRFCVVIPTYNNPVTLRPVVEAARLAVPDVLVVNDGSDAVGTAACAALAQEGLAVVVHRQVNGGKGAAVKRGLKSAADAGFTHAVQVDADGQHDLSQLAAFVQAARENPSALVLGYPQYDATVPSVRLQARRITKFWVDLEVGRGVVTDAMVGFRVYPIAQALAVGTRGDRMDFDVEIAVRLAWAGVPIVNLPVGVRYLTEEEGGLSHFQPIRDNLRLGWMHSRLCTVGATRWCMRKLRLIR